MAILNIQKHPPFFPPFKGGKNMIFSFLLTNPLSIEGEGQVEDFSNQFIIIQGSTI
jgi:hypothetical protein